MRIAIVGGTGDIGKGLALRIAEDTDHTVSIGSRDREKASKEAEAYRSRLKERNSETSIEASSNADVVTDADVVILAVPPFHAGDTVEAISPELDREQILVSPAVGMQNDESGLHYQPPDTGSVTELVAERAPAEVQVAGAFHNLSAHRLADLDADLNLDTLVVADAADVRKTVLDLANEIDGLRPLDAGPLANAAEVESITPLVINIARYNDGLHDVGIRFH